MVFEKGNRVMKYPKTITSLICLLSLLLSGALATVGAQDSLRIWLSSEIAQATAGQEFVVTVNVTGANQVYGGSFQLLYDPQVFEVILVDNQAVSPGAFFGSEPSFALKNMVDATTGTVDYALTLTQPAVPVTGEGMLGTVKFRALQDAPVVITPAGAQLVSPDLVAHFHYEPASHQTDGAAVGGNCFARGEWPRVDRDLVRGDAPVRKFPLAQEVGSSFHRDWTFDFSTCAI